MNVYDDILDATVVSRSVKGHFTTCEYTELITVRTSIISVYKVEDDGRHLLLTNEFDFRGKIKDIALIPSKESNEEGSDGNRESSLHPMLDYMLISSGVAKLSIVRFDVESNNLETVSLHYYEDKLKETSLVELATDSQLRTDPNGKCSLLFNNDSIAILPFGEDEKLEDDEDVYMGDVGEEEPDKKRRKTQSQNTTTFTEPSIVISLKKLNKEIQNVADIQFLKNYTKPTIAILYQPRLTWAGSLKISKTPTCVMILTLELRSVNTKTEVEPIMIAKLQNLPWSWNQIVPTEKGSVIIGVNEIAYIDNTGVLQSVISLNSYSDKSIIKSKIIDNSKLELILNRNSVVTYWSSTTSNNNDGNNQNVDNNNDLLVLMTEQSNLYYIQLEFEGKLLTTFDIIELPIANNIFINNLGPTCISGINNNSSSISAFDMFIGFQSGNSLLVRLNNMKSTIASRSSHTHTVDDDDNIFSEGDDNDEDDEDEDLYADDILYNKNKEKSREEIVETVEPFDIELLSSLTNIGPLTSVTIGNDSSIEPRIKGLPNPSNGEMSIVATSGNGVGSHLVSIQPSVHPEIQLALKFISITQIWTLKFKNKDKFLITTDSFKSKSDIYEIENNFAQYKEGRLRRDATTVHISMFGNDTRIVQVTTNHLYLYDLDFRRLTTIKFDYEVVHVSVMDNYILITVSRGDIKVYELETRQKKKLFKVNLPEILKEMVITSGLILKSDMCNEFLNLKDMEEEQLLFTFVTADNQIIFFTKDHNDRIFQLTGVDDLKDCLFVSTYQLPEEVVPDPSIKQAMLNTLGNKNKEIFLTILTFGGEVYQYKKSNRRASRFYKNACGNKLPIVGAPNNAYAKGVTGIERIMHYIPNYKGYSCIFITGNVPYIILKEDTSVPRLFKFANIPLVSLTPWGKKSVMCVDHIKNARVYTLDDTNIYYGNKLPLKSITINNVLQNFMTFNNIAYHEKSQMFVVSYTKEIEYVPKSENDEIIVGSMDNMPHAKGFQSGVLLINPKTWGVIDQITLGANSLVNDLRSMIIQVDSKTKRNREYIVFGVGQVGSEDLPASGSFHMYDILSIGSEPGQPDATSKFEKFFSEDVRGSVTTVCELSGRFSISQSQKILVRDAQEDNNSVVPVAFFDTPVYVTDSKSFGNFFIVGDSMQGFQFIGFDAEPYRMLSLGRSMSKLETVAVDFLVNNGDLYFAVTDRNNIFHVLKYAPDEPNSLSGQRLVHCSSFNLYSTNTCLKLLPKNEEFIESDHSTVSYQVIGAQVDGSMFKVIPLGEDTYRRLYVIQQQLGEKEIQLGGLNPNMERLANDFYDISNVMRPVLDYNVIKKFASLPIEKRNNLGKKTGRRSDVNLWRDLIDIEFSLRTLSK
ncbi:similar to Saccharomyces cerevisiae YDR301W CFT1 RNA-binding subunit of the mRNA cleavage and polyadenylation factor [Maudiozyma barnettii]|uniref:DNA damage-binding protein 1 n=1 Tax=Maudiozyma barnettii TaxID=61262 RepID=A0A8H2ZHN7_9SACH|nr:cleavage/polyadenylation factor CFT1 [Kazachstania barnettii]CAB4254963.1 similar to Saccharomyces cerevisiae YDR301W CFT1 RNA-binding subunit of the mRNA cleavage and polyadenylation factor [Kazachstania barnettii]CAD1783234.1 similar to Saccharomyces cerevisiae YDR301W CFT1 RNA-binding subunit of the mRNA cleavage and polyadenylation factor [Kazachstania barnettii]